MPSKIERMVDGVWSKLLARGSMVLVGIAVLPMGKWIVDKNVSTLDKLVENQAAITETVKLLGQEVVYNKRFSEDADKSLKEIILNLRAELIERSSDRYRSEDAVRDFRLRDQRLDNHENRIITLERR